MRFDSVLEKISKLLLAMILVYFLAMAGGFFLDSGTVWFTACGYVAMFAWYALSILVIALVCIILIYFWKFLLTLYSPERELGRSEQKQRFPWFWVILAVTGYAAYMMLNLLLLRVGGGA